MATIPLKVVQAQLAEIIERLTPGQELVLMRDNQPVATIRAIPPMPPKRRDWRDAVEDLRTRLGLDGRKLRLAEKIDGETMAMRYEWELHQLGNEPLQVDRTKQASAPPAENAE